MIYIEILQRKLISPLLYVLQTYSANLSLLVHILLKFFLVIKMTKHTVFVFFQHKFMNHFLYDIRLMHPFYKCFSNSRQVLTTVQNWLTLIITEQYQLAEILTLDDTRNLFLSFHSTFINKS